MNETNSDVNWSEMLVENVESLASTTVVQTTGSIITIHHTNPGRIEAVQRINGPRQAYEVEFNASFERAAVDFQDDEECALYCPVLDFGFNIRIFADSLMWIRAGEAVRVRVSGDWLPEYSYAEAGNMILLDSKGGLGHYIVGGQHPYGSPTFYPEPGISFTKRGWELRYSLPAAQKALFCVAPPRSFNHVQLVKSRIIHHHAGRKMSDGSWNPFPTDGEVAEYAKVGNILTLHSWAAVGAGPMKMNHEVRSREDMYEQYAPWAARYLATTNEPELTRVVDLAHKLGMRVIPYFSPLFFPGTAHEFLAELKRFLGEWKFDGVYYDGISEDIVDAYEIMKGTRKLIGADKVIYAHIPSPIIGSSYAEGKYVYCPFVDTYADFILRGEHVDDFDDATLRYTISGYNISNAIGLTCNYDYNIDFSRELINKALNYKVGVPYWGAIDDYLTDRGRAKGIEYPKEADIQKIMHDDYFPALDRLAKEL